MGAPDNPPAFPRIGEGFGNPSYDTPGMSLRDWFAGQALAGDLASQNEFTGEWPTTSSGEHLRGRAEFFYRFADAMLAARATGA